MSSIKPKIALIGGGGFLGRHLRKIMEPSFDIVYTSRNRSGIQQLDLLQPATFEPLKSQGPFECIFILASSLKGLGTTELKKEYLELETIGLSNLLQYIHENSLTNRFIFISSMTVYGLNNEIPVSEGGRLEPFSTYGLGKTLAEKIFQFHCLQSPINCVILRIPGLYGGDRTSGFIYHTIQKCIRQEPIQIDTASLGYWETMHVEDCSKIIESLLSAYNWQEKINTFNIGYGVKTDMEESALFIREILGSSSEIKLIGKKGYIDFYLDISKIRQFVEIESQYKDSLQKYIRQLAS